MKPMDKPNPECRFCHGKGYVLVRIDEWDVDKDPCDCVFPDEEEKDETK